MTVLDLSRETLPDDTPIYKYINVKTFFDYYLNPEQPTLFFQDIYEWYDGHEGLIQKLIDKSHANNSYLGCCWSLCTDDSRLYGNADENKAANQELVNYGSDGMWQTYCPNGGVRIQTTIGKLRGVLEGIKYLEGKVKYASNKIPIGYDRENIEDGALFIKRIPFRHENEYRFIIISSRFASKLFLKIDLMDFVDEFLVSPQKPPSQKSSLQNSREIYLEICRKDYVAECSAVKAERPYKKPSIRISQLYEAVSQERQGG